MKLKDNFDFLDKRCVCREHYEAAHHKTQTDSGGRPDQVNISIYRITCMFIPHVFQLSLKWLYGRGHFKSVLISLRRRTLYKYIEKSSKLLCFITVYWKYSPSFYIWLLSPSLSADEFNTGQIPVSKINSL